MGFSFRASPEVPSGSLGDQSHKIILNNPTLIITYTTPPSAATNPNPSNGATNQSRTVDPSWSNGGGATSYNVYFGTDPTPDSGEYKGNQSGTSYNPGTLSYSTTYYWRIDARNAAGTTTGYVWHFSTEAQAIPPSKATNPSPSNGATNQSINIDPSWSNSDGATSYNVYFGTDPTPDIGEYKGNQSGTSYNPGTLSYGTTYYWRIDAKNSAGTTTGNVWHFTTESQVTLPNAATNPNPSNGATNQSITVDPSWSNGGGATSYDVYFGTDPTPDSGEYKGNQSGTSYNPGTLSYNTTYYWRIDAKNSAGTTTGDIWRLTTEADPTNVAIDEYAIEIPTEFFLFQNYPNPFNPTTAISYQIPITSFVRISIYDIHGRLVEALVNGKKNPGYYNVEWNAEKVGSGIYFYRIDAGEFSSVKKCLVVK